MTFRTQRGSKPIISLFHWCFAIHLLNPTRFTRWSRCLNGKLSMTSFDNCTYGTLLQRGQRKFRRLVFNDRVKRKPQVNWDPVHMYELSSVFAVHTPTNSPNRRYCSMFFKKIMHAWGLEKLLVDARAERECVQQFKNTIFYLLFTRTVNYKYNTN